jgi:uncharacterized protein YycO
MMRIVLLLSLLGLTGCLARTAIDNHDPSLHQSQNDVIATAITEKARTGDWLVIRGYHATDQLVANATGIPISHVGIYNGNTRQVIEAEGKGVHLTDLEDFIDKSYRLLIIRPRWRSPENSEAAWAAAEALVNKDYDFLGTIGFDFPDHYYCSELAIYIYRPWYSGKERFPDVIKPGELYLFGTVLYDSLPRDEM